MVLQIEDQWCDFCGRLDKSSDVGLYVVLSRSDDDMGDTNLFVCATCLPKLKKQMKRLSKQEGNARNFFRQIHDEIAYVLDPNYFEDKVG